VDVVVGRQAGDGIHAITLVRQMTVQQTRCRLLAAGSSRLANATDVVDYVRVLLLGGTR
jgi:hypothetical protein